MGKKRGGWAGSLEHSNLSHWLNALRKNDPLPLAFPASGHLLLRSRDSPSICLPALGKDTISGIGLALALQHNASWSFQSTLHRFSSDLLLSPGYSQPTVTSHSEFQEYGEISA